jgi:signal transduction histidine kinase
LLEDQKDALAKSHGVLTAKSTELQRANEYKSEFLANMSHELRTPLNSTLILAKLLADNKDGNLTEQQVKFAQTITSAGNDLLSLINDVLDLVADRSG